MVEVLPTDSEPIEADTDGVVPLNSDVSYEENKEIHIGTLCKVNYLLLCLAVVSFFCSFLSPIFSRLIPISVVVIVFEAIAKPFSYFGVSSSGLTEYRFGKKMRKIGWEQIIQIGKQLDSLGIGTPSGVIVTLHGAPKYTKQTNMSSFRYFLLYRPHVLYIYDFDKSISIIEQYYGSVDYACKEDLENN